MIKVTYNDILRASSSMKKLIERELPVRQAIALSRLIKKLNAEIEIFDGEQRKIVSKYAIVNQGTGESRIPESKQKDYNDAMTDLLGLSVEIDSEKIEIDGLENIEASVILNTEPFVDFKE